MRLCRWFALLFFPFLFWGALDDFECAFYRITEEKYKKHGHARAAYGHFRQLELNGGLLKDSIQTLGGECHGGRGQGLMDIYLFAAGGKGGVTFLP